MAGQTGREAVNANSCLGAAPCPGYASAEAYRRGLNDYQCSGPTFRIELQYHIPHIDLKTALLLVWSHIYIYIYICMYTHKTHTHIYIYI